MKLAPIFSVGLLVLGTLGLSACGGHKYHLVPSFTVPAATGKVDVGHDDNGTTYDLKVRHLAKPQNLTPPETAYVVWVQRPGLEAQNAGVLTVNDDLNGEFRGTTPYKSFDLFVTAEPNPRASLPSGPRVLQQHMDAA